MAKWRLQRDVTRDTSKDADNPRADGDEEDSQSRLNEQIVEEIENWHAEVQRRKLQALQNAPATETDSWLQYTAWNQVLNQSKHDLVETRDPPVH